MSTLQQWMEHWLEKIAPRKARPSTIAAYRSLINTWILPHLGAVKLDKLTPEHLDDLYDEMRLGYLSDTTILKGHRVLSRALTVAVQRGKLGSNPCSRMDEPTAERLEITPLTTDDARAILNAAKDGPPALDEGQVAGRPHHQIFNAARWTVAQSWGYAREKPQDCAGTWSTSRPVASGSVAVGSESWMATPPSSAHSRPKAHAGPS
nr:N-terminal phage integrase SAM-like domain-containing protein [Arthrobacter sp. UCD-GKA]